MNRPKRKQPAAPQAAQLPKGHTKRTSAMIFKAEVETRDETGELVGRGMTEETILWEADFGPELRAYFRSRGLPCPDRVEKAKPSAAS